MQYDYFKYSRSRQQFTFPKSYKSHQAQVEFHVIAYNAGLLWIGGCKPSDPRLSNNEIEWRSKEPRSTFFLSSLIKVE